MNMPTKDGPAAETIEDVGGEFGFRIVWSCKPHWADFKAYEMQASCDDGPIFNNDCELPGAGDVANAEPYLSGYVKWDGCCDLTWGETHFCGPRDLIKSFALVKHIYLRAGELCGHNHLESPWPSGSTKTS